MNFNSNFFMPRRAHAPTNTMAGAKRSGTQAKGERETRTRAERVWRQGYLPGWLVVVMRPSCVMKRCPLNRVYS
jgi:hypothetical protein